MTQLETPINFDARHRWFHRPDFLRQLDEEWPTEVKSVREKTGENIICHEQKTHYEYLPDMNNIAKWQVLMCTTGRVLQFTYTCPKGILRQQRNASAHGRTSIKIPF
ncbi:unnamed protein product [Parnassius apollo]|uniref:(apollo) hypothetical protein n=1 Tax=Parnassius apollo TaxID=110799 RepID=A0A8S3WIW1_PARAO|nr:unnamed protein product [Parnassius apollo]